MSSAEIGSESKKKKKKKQKKKTTDDDVSISYLILYFLLWNASFVYIELVFSDENA